jgi:hypothetical protein
MISSIFESIKSIRRVGFIKYWVSLERKYELALIIIAVWILLRKLDIIT